jgi:uncharacterized DUF497 family protein
MAGCGWIRTVSRFEWDAAKPLGNLAKHGIDFVDVSAVWLGGVWTRRSPYPGEERQVSIGPLAGDVVVIIWPLRGAKRRLISAKGARRDERKDYDGFLGRSG